MSQPLRLHDGAGLASVLATAGRRARAQRRPVLVGLGERVSAVDPLLALETVVRASASDERLAAHVAAGRAYWTRASDGFALAGLGAVGTIAPTGPDRFALAERAWLALVEGGIFDDGGGPGPILMGGFSFDPAGPRTESWQGFPSAHLILPRLQLAAIGGQCWLMISAVVGEDGEPDVAASELTRLRRIAMAAVAAEAPAPIDPLDAAITVSSPVSRSAWQALVGAGVDAIRRGEMRKVVLAREVRASAPREVDVFATLRHLRAAHRDCLVFGYWRGASAFVGASPERLVRLEGRLVQASSLAGSAARGASDGEDAALAAALLASAKDQAEHAMVRDALREGLADLCDDVVAPAAPSLLTLRHVHHLHTAVNATLRPGHTLLELVARLHPTPAVGGTPRDAALRFIQLHERLDRGWYAAPIGWMGRTGGEFAVALRSAVVSGREATLIAGCGIVADSDPVREFAESLMKLRPMQAALAAALGARAPDADQAVVGAEFVR